MTHYGANKCTYERKTWNSFIHLNILAFLHEISYVTGSQRLNSFDKLCCSRLILFLKTCLFNLGVFEALDIKFGLIYLLELNDQKTIALTGAMLLFYQNFKAFINWTEIHTHMNISQSRQ